MFDELRKVYAVINVARSKYTHTHARTHTHIHTHTLKSWFKICKIFKFGWKIKTPTYPSIYPCFHSILWLNIPSEHMTLNNATSASWRDIDVDSTLDRSTHYKGVLTNVCGVCCNNMLIWCCCCTRNKANLKILILWAVGSPVPSSANIYS